MKHSLDTIRPNLYVVRNQEGFYFRAKGFSGRGKSWVEDINDAKFYAKLGQARSRVTFFSKNYPDYDIPEILKLKVEGAEVLEEKDRVKKIIKKAEIAKINQAKRYAEYRKKQCQEEINRLTEEVNYPCLKAGACKAINYGN